MKREGRKGVEEMWSVLAVLKNLVGGGGEGERIWEGGERGVRGLGLWL